MDDKNMDYQGNDSVVGWQSSFWLNIFLYVSLGPLIIHRIIPIHDLLWDEYTPWATDMNSKVCGIQRARWNLGMV